MNDDDLIAILRDVCRMCGTRAASLVVADDLTARWPVLAERGVVEIASTRFTTPGGADACIHLFDVQQRKLSAVQTMVLTAYAEHTRVSLL